MKKKIVHLNEKVLVSTSHEDFDSYKDYREESQTRMKIGKDETDCTTCVIQ